MHIWDCCFRFYDLFVLTFFIIIMCLSLLKKTHTEFEKEIKLITSNDNKDNKVFIEHNKRILKVLLTRSEIQQLVIQGYENNITLSRNFYSIILIGLFYFIITEISSGIVYLTMFAIIILYLLEIHLKDLLNGQNYAKIVTLRSIDYLIDNFEDRKLYISYINFRNYMDKLAGLNRFKRKLLKAFKPDFLQFVYYFIPWIITYLIARCKGIIF